MNFSDFTDLEQISKRWNDLTNDSNPKENQINQEENSKNPKFSEEISKIPKFSEEMAKSCLENTNTLTQSKNSTDFREQETKWEEIKPIITKSKNIGGLKENNNNNIKTRNVFPQIIDEDTENFRIKLDHLINVFKNDALGEFMNMKKFLLENQVKTIKNETEKYLNMYEEKHNQLEKTNQKLAEKINENEILNKRVLELSNLCGKNKNKWRNHKILFHYFNQLALYRKQRLLKKKLEAISKTNYQKRLLISSLSNWKSNLQKIKLEKQKSILTEKFNEESNEMIIKFNKENELLQKRLQETKNTLDEINVSKEEMQENLKRAFMRGVCALNFEAMNILQEKKKGNEEDLVIQTNGLTKKMMDINENLNFNGITINPLEKNEKSEKSFVENREEDAENEKNSEEIVANNKKIVYFQAPKMESKDHKWREAPVMGINNFTTAKNEDFGEIKNGNFAEFETKFNRIQEPMPEIKRIKPEEKTVLREIENLPPKIKQNVFMQESERDQGKVIVANVFNNNGKKKTETKKEPEVLQKKKSISTSSANLKRGKI